MRTTAPESRDSTRLGFFAARAFLGVGFLFASKLRFGVSLFVLLAAPLVSCATPRGTVGAVIAQEPETGRLFLRDVPPGLAAARAGLKPGDEILLIDGVDVRVLSEKEIHAVLTGDVDSEVKLTVIRGEEVRRVTLRRTQARKLAPNSAP